MFDGSIAIFERVKRPDVTHTIATVGDSILVEDQQQPDSNPFISLPGGRVDKGEEPLASAKRELREETGYVSDDWELLSEKPTEPQGERTIYSYIARDCRLAGAAEPDAGEKISVRKIGFERFLMLSDEPLFRHSDMVEMLLRARFIPEEREKLKRKLFG